MDLRGISTSELLLPGFPNSATPEDLGSNPGLAQLLRNLGEMLSSDWLSPELQKHLQQAEGNLSKSRKFWVQLEILWRLVEDLIREPRELSLGALQAVQEELTWAQVRKGNSQISQLLLPETQPPQLLPLLLPELEFRLREKRENLQEFLLGNPKIPQIPPKTHLGKPGIPKIPKIPQKNPKIPPKNPKIPPKISEILPKISEIPPKIPEFPPKNPPKTPKIPQIEPQIPQIPPNQPKIPQIEPQIPQIFPKNPQIRPKIPQIPPEIPPEIPQIFPKNPQIRPKIPQIPPKIPQIPPKIPQIQPKLPEISPKIPENPKKIPLKIPKIPPKIPEISPKITEISPKITEISPKIPEISPKIPEISPEIPEFPEIPGFCPKTLRLELLRERRREKILEERKERTEWELILALSRCRTHLSHLARLSSAHSHLQLGLGSFLRAKGVAMLLRARLEELRVLLDTYPSPTIAAHRRIRAELRGGRGQAEASAAILWAELQRFRDLGPKFGHLAAELGKIRQRAEQQRWALRELRPPH